MNLSDLDALAARSGLRPAALRRSGSRLPVAAFSIAAVLGLGLLAFLAIRFGGMTDARSARIQAVAPRLCAQRWPHSSTLFIENGDQSASIACGSPTSRVVAGRIEVAYP